jgi:hypothetical protein
MGWNKSKYVHLWFETMRLFQIILVNNLIPTLRLIVSRARFVTAGAVDLKLDIFTPRSADLAHQILVRSGSWFGH